MKTNIMHKISSNNFISYHPYLGTFLREAVAVFGLGLLIMMLEVIKHCRWSASALENVLEVQ